VSRTEGTLVVVLLLALLGPLVGPILRGQREGRSLALQEDAEETRRSSAELAERDLLLRRLQFGLSLLALVSASGPGWKVLATIALLGVSGIAVARLER
jgi:hypothetical protein